MCCVYAEQDPSPSKRRFPPDNVSLVTPVEAERLGLLSLTFHDELCLNGTAPSVRATGVQFKAASKAPSARREVIFAAGGTHIPHVPHLSASAVLAPLGI